MSADPYAADPYAAEAPSTDAAEASDADRAWPPVSVVMPVLNEERHLRSAVHRILQQDYPGELEVVMALGPSQDATTAVAAALTAEDARVRTVPNPSGRTPTGLNAAIRASRHSVIVRVDGHGLLGGDYIRTAVQLLVETGADNVGGMMAAEGETPFETAVARAMTSRFGVGNARFHTGGEAGPADTVYLGAFRRDTLERLGGYDESFSRAQDWELNHRIRTSGGVVWFSPRLRVTYRPRRSVRTLAKQYFHYGRWRRVVMRQHPGTATIRYLAAPTAVVAITAGTALAGVGGLLGRRWTRVGLLAPLGYATGVVAATVLVGRGEPVGVRVRLPLVLATMHMSWGIGFLTSPPALHAIPEGD